MSETAISKRLISILISKYWFIVVVFNFLATTELGKNKNRIKKPVWCKLIK